MTESDYLTYFYVNFFHTAFLF